MEIKWRNVACAAYEAYAEQTGNKNFRGEEMPTFDELPEAIQLAWVAAVERAWTVLSAAVRA
jgi:hypothetical protein